MADNPVPPPASPAPPAPTGSFLEMFNIFVDPQGAAQYVVKPWSWLWPLLISGIVIGVTGYLLVPTTVRIMQINPPGNLTPEQLQRSLPTIITVQKVTAFATPVIAALMMALLGGLLSAACAVMDIKSTFRNNFALIANGSLIGMFQQVAGFCVVRLKGDDIQSLKELRPGFGLDLLLPEGANRFLLGTLNYFSIFTIWYIVIIGLTFAFMTKTSKGKAFAATAWIWLLGLLFAFVGAYFNK